MSQRTRVTLAMLTLYVVWGTTYLAIKVGVEAGMPPAAFAALRLIPAAGIMFLIAKLRGAKIALPARDIRIVSLVGILLLVGGQYGMMVAEQYVGSGIAALVVAINPLWIALAESAFPDMQRPGKLGWVGLALGFSGLALLLAPTIGGFRAGATELLGIGIVVAGTWMWSSGSIFSKRHPVKADGLVIAAYEMLAAGLVTLVIAGMRGEFGAVPTNARAAGALSYLILMGSCLAFTAFVYALSHLPASKVLTYAYVNPVIAVFAGWAAGRIGLVPDEPITAWTLAGMVVIVAGVALATTAPTLPPRHQSDLQDTSLIEPQPSEA